MRSPQVDKQDITAFYFGSLHVQLCCGLVARHFLATRDCSVLCLSFFFFVDSMAFQLYNKILLYINISSTTILFHKARLNSVRAYLSNSVMLITPENHVMFFLVTIALLVPYFCICAVIGMFVNGMHRRMHSTSFCNFLRQFLLLCIKTVPLICLLSLYMASFFNVPQVLHVKSTPTNELLISFFSFMGLVLYYGVARGLVNFDATMSMTYSQSGHALTHEMNTSALLVQHMGYSLYKQPQVSFAYALKLTYDDLSDRLHELLRYISNCTSSGVYSHMTYLLLSVLHNVRQKKGAFIPFLIELVTMGLIGLTLLSIPTILLYVSLLDSGVYDSLLPQRLSMVVQSINLDVMVSFLLTFGLDFALVHFCYSFFVAIFPHSALLVLSRLGFWFRILEGLKIARIISLYSYQSYYNYDHSHNEILFTFIRMQLCSITLSRFIVISIQYKLISVNTCMHIIANTQKRLSRHREIYGSSGVRSLDFETAHLPYALRAQGECNMTACAIQTQEQHKAVFDIFWKLFYSNLSGNWSHYIMYQSQNTLIKASDDQTRFISLPCTFLQVNIPIFVIEAEWFITVYKTEVNNSDILQLYKHILEYQESCLTCIDPLFLVKSTLETVAMFFCNTVKAFLGRLILIDESKQTTGDTPPSNHAVTYRSLISGVTSSSSAVDTYNASCIYNSTETDGNTFHKGDSSTKESTVLHSNLSQVYPRNGDRLLHVHKLKEVSLSDTHNTEQVMDSTRVTPTTLKHDERYILRSLDYMKAHPFQVTPRLIHKFTDMHLQNSELVSLQTPLINVDFLDSFEGPHDSVDQHIIEESSSLSVTGQKLLEYQQIERVLHDISYNASSIDQLSLSCGEVENNSNSQLNLSTTIQGTHMTFPIPFSQQCSINDTPSSSCNTPITTPNFHFSNISSLLSNKKLPYPSFTRKYKLKELEILNYLAVDDTSTLMDTLKERALYSALLEEMERILSTSFFDWVFVLGFTISPGYSESVYSKIIDKASKAQFMLQYARVSNSTIRVLPKLFLSSVPSSLGITLLVARCRKDQHPLVHVIQCHISLDTYLSSISTSLNVSQASNTNTSISIEHLAILDHQRLILICKTMQVFVITLERLQNHYKAHKLASMMYTRKKREKSQYLSYIMHCLNCAIVFHSISTCVIAKPQLFSQEQRRFLISLHRFAELNVYNLEVILSIIRFKAINLDGFTKRIQSRILSSHDVSITLTSRGSSWNLFDILDKVLVLQNLTLVSDLQPTYTITPSTRRWRSPGSCSIQAYSLLCPHNAQCYEEKGKMDKQSTVELIKYVIYTNVQMTYNFRLAFLIISSLHRYLYSNIVDVHISDGLGEGVDYSIQNDIVYGSSEVILQYQNTYSGHKNSKSVASSSELQTTLMTNYLTVCFVIEKIPPRLYDVFAVAVCNCWDALCSDMPFIYLQKSLEAYLSRKHGIINYTTQRARSCPTTRNSCHNSNIASDLHHGKEQNTLCTQADWCVESVYLLDANKILSHILALKALLFEQCSFFIDKGSIHLRVHMKRAGDPGLSTLMLPDTDSCASSVHSEQDVMQTPPHVTERKLYHQRMLEAPRLTADLNHKGTVERMGRLYPNLLDPVSEDASKSEVSHGYADIQPSVMSTKLGCVPLHRLALVVLFTEPARILRLLYSIGSSLNMELLQYASEDDINKTIYPVYVLCQLSAADSSSNNTSVDDSVLLTCKGYMPRASTKDGVAYPIIFKSVTAHISLYSFCIALNSLFNELFVSSKDSVN